VTKIGVGESQEREPFQAGARAAQAALKSAGVTACHFALMFATVGYNQEKLLRGVRSVLGQARLSGCSGAGIITQTGPHGETAFSLSGAETDMETIGLMVFASDELSFHPFTAEGLKDNSGKAGGAIGKALAGTERPQLLFLFADAYSVNINALFAGLEGALPSSVPFVGGLSGHNLPLSTLTYQYSDDRVLTDAAVGALVSGAADFELGVSHGCLPIGMEKRITCAQRNTIVTIENRPAWSYFQEYLEDDVDTLDSESATMLSIGEKLPAAVATEYDQYIIRAPLYKNQDGSIAFATEFKDGALVRIVRRDEDKISLGASALAKRMRDSHGGKAPAAVLQFDCAGRGRMFFGDRVKEMEVDVVQDVLGRDIPWLGLFCFGEIAPIKGFNYAHNQTVALCALYF
jgi:hypothetical protein